MKTKSMMLLAVAMALFQASGGDTSEATLVSLNPDKTPFWRTFQSNEVQLDLAFPAGATSADLEVTGVKYRRTYSGLTAGSIALTLPALTDVTGENVYQLTVSYDNGMVRTASVGCVRGVRQGAGSVLARCVTDTSSADWTKTASKVVLPIPYGAETVSVDGVPADTGLGGACGWLALKLASGARAVALDDGDPVSLDVMAPGFLLLLR